MKSWKNWLITVMSIIGVGLILITALVVIVDPFFQYHKPIKGFPYVVDNQLSQNPGMAKHLEYDSVMLGSSMTVNFDMSWFRELLNRNTIKLSYSGAYPKDQDNIMKLVFEANPNVEQIFMGIDVITYGADVKETKYPIPEYLYDTNVWNDIPYLWNKDVLLNYIIRPIMDPKDASNLDTIYEMWWTDEYFNEEYVLAGYEAAPIREGEFDYD